MNQLFEVSGISLDGQISVLYGITVPGETADTIVAPQGSVYFKTDGTIFTKIASGSGLAAWKESGVDVIDNGVRTLLNVGGTSIIDAVESATTSTFIWAVTAQSVTNPANKQVLVVTALHDGSSGVAPTVLTYNLHSKLKTGSPIAGFTVLPALSIAKDFITLTVITSEVVNIQSYRMIGQSGGSGSGTVGAAGPQGIQGIQGIQGEKGDQGDQGIPGPAGEAGGVGGTSILSGDTFPLTPADGDYFFKTGQNTAGTGKDLIGPVGLYQYSLALSDWVTSGGVYVTEDDPYLTTSSIALGSLWYQHSAGILRVFNASQNWVDLGGGGGGTPTPVEIATTTTLGVVSVGAGLEISPEGVLTNKSGISGSPVGSTLIFGSHFDEGDGFVTIHDEAGHTYGDQGLYLRSSHFKFGVSSLECNGNGYFYFGPNTDAPDFYFGTSDFTIEWWEYPLSAAGGRFNIASNVLVIAPSSDEGLTLRNTGSAYVLGINGDSHSVTGPCVLNTWSHRALVRHMGVIKLYVDGVALNSFCTNNSVVPNLPTNAWLNIGNYAAGSNGFTGDNGFDGFIDDFRIIGGAALYTANFTPPTEAYGTGFNGGLGGYSLTTASVDSVLFEFVGAATPTVGSSRWTPFCPMKAVRFYFTSDTTAVGAIMELCVNGLVVSTCSCLAGGISEMAIPNASCTFGDSITVNIAAAGGATNLRAYVIMAMNLSSLT